ncbi:MAG TPA: family 10 glycosylhydrolase [Flavisolibacter sp.]|nr:family 10 glycosylhydrolase [Flavisolibacter sp.]
MTMKQAFSICILFLVLSCSAQRKTQPAEAVPVRGTWVTNVASDALTSKEKIAETIERCKQFGLNTIYVVTWNKGVTMYPSPVVEKYIGIRQDTLYKGFDPIKEIIAQGHEAGMKVIAWFEYGFAYDYGDTSSIWHKRYPHWAGRDAQGRLLQKNKFYWWNSLHPEVQQFMTELVLDFVRRYDADGVQGDDRLPAMPSEGGYDDYTKSLYAKENNGASPPADSKNAAWLQWRADKLNAYIKDLYSRIKAEKKSYIVSWAPSIYPWSKEQYLQDWPAWLNGGYADEILPQCYRYDLKAYEKTIVDLDKQVTPEQKSKVFPGVLIGLGDGYQIKQELLEQMIQINRQYGFKGECTFYYEGMKKLTPFYKGSLQ